MPLPAARIPLRISALLLPCLLLSLLAGCAIHEPALWPHDPPPNIPADQVLLVLPEEVVAELAQDEVRTSRQAALDAEVTWAGRRPLDSARLQRVREHTVVTGMSVQEVVWCFEAHPTSVRDQGPPGGHTLLWDPGGRAAGKRYWVRFDGWGRAHAAGQF